jgi:acyl carrier protein
MVIVEPSTLLDDLRGFIADDVITGDEPVDVDTDLVSTGLVDSLGVVRVVEWLERRLSIRIDASDVVIEHFESIAAIVDYLRGRGDCAVD